MLVTAATDCECAAADPQWHACGSARRACATGSARRL